MSTQRVLYIHILMQTYSDHWQIYNSTVDLLLAADGITVPEAGVYQVTSNCYMRVTGSAQRPSVGTRFAINGVEQDEIAAMGYIRNSNTSHESYLCKPNNYSRSKCQ